MGKYLLRRFLILIPTLLAITLVAFIISINAPGDPVDNLLSGQGQEGKGNDLFVAKKDYIEKRKELGLNLPVFYFALSSWAEPDTLYQIVIPKDRDFLKTLIYQFGNWNEISAFYQRLQSLASVVKKPPYDSVNIKRFYQLNSALGEISQSSSPEILSHIVNRLDSVSAFLSPEDRDARIASAEIKTAWNTVITHSQKWKIYVPAIYWFGSQNQYHRWLMKIMVFDFGVSIVDQRSITTKFLEALPWTLVLNLLSLFLSYFISIPLGIYAAVNRDSYKEKIVSTFLFVLHSLPAFWIATLLIGFLCNPDYVNWFPSSGIQATDHAKDWPLFQKLSDWAYHLILPLFCFTYPHFAYLSRQMRVGMLETLSQDYIRTARAKGLNEKMVIMTHAVRNSLIPIVTIMGGFLPALIGGSIIIESIFSIPGMGYTMWTALNNRDYPLIIAFFTLLGLLTQIGILMSDVLYSVLDPRISLNRKK